MKNRHFEAIWPQMEVVVVVFGGSKRSRVRVRRSTKGNDITHWQNISWTMATIFHSVVFGALSPESFGQIQQQCTCKTCAERIAHPRRRKSQKIGKAVRGARHSWSGKIHTWMHTHTHENDRNTGQCVCVVCWWSRMFYSGACSMLDKRTK